MRLLGLGRIGLRIGTWFRIVDGTAMAGLRVLDRFWRLGRLLDGVIRWIGGEFDLRIVFGFAQMDYLLQFTQEGRSCSVTQ